MKATAGSIAGLLLGVVVTCLIGFLEIQRTGIRAGGVIGVDNQLVAVTEPQTGLLQSVGIAIVGVFSIVISFCVPRSWGKSADYATRLGILAGIGIAITVAAVLDAQTVSSARLEEPQPEWALGWLLEGGTSVAVYTVFLAILVCLILRVRNLSVPQSEPTPAKVGD